MCLEVSANITDAIFKAHPSAFGHKPYRNANVTKRQNYSCHLQDPSSKWQLLCLPKGCDSSTSGVALPRKPESSHENLKTRILFQCPTNIQLPNMFVESNSRHYRFPVFVLNPKISVEIWTDSLGSTVFIGSPKESPEHFQDQIISWLPRKLQMCKHSFDCDLTFSRGWNVRRVAT
jgi:hypothetical protein